MTAPDLAPLLQLRVQTERLTLRLPDEDELAQLAVIARRGVHPPEQMPFLVPWTRPSPTFTADFLGYHRETHPGFTGPGCFNGGV